MSAMALAATVGRVSPALAGVGHSWMSAEPQSYRAVESSLLGQYETPQLLAVNSAGEWNAQMSVLAYRNALTVTPGPPAPEGVDWTQEAVVLVALGSYPTAAWDLEALGARVVDNRLVLTVRMREYQPYLSMMTSPYVVLAVPKGTWHGNQVLCEYVNDSGQDMAAAYHLQTESTKPGVMAVSWGEVKALNR